MPKYCTAPNCKNDAGNDNPDRKSYYKFPLQDPARLQQWLKNMGREGWTPSRHQHLCHKHFAPSCFTTRWGVRYLASDAVPTVFQSSDNTQKRKSTNDGDRRSKRLRGSGRRFASTVPTANTPEGERACQDSDGGTVQLYAVTVEPAHSGRPLLLESMDIEPSVDPVQAAVPLGELDGHGGAGSDFPMTLFQTVEDVGVAGGGEHAEVVVVSKGPLTDKEDAMEGLAAAVLTGGQDVVISDAAEPSSLVIENVALEMVEPPAAQDDRGIQVIAYFETIPNVLPSTLVPLGPPPDTVLSSALSSKPIVSTLPIVSKHVPPSPGSLVLTLERLETAEAEVEGEREQGEDGAEQPGKQLEEHRYHKNSLSKEQLEAIVIELQKKVKVLQQRHRRHLDKLLGLESTVSQLRHSNLLSDERLQLLERAYIQTSAAVSDAGETVAIICEDENTAYLYALPKRDEDVGLDPD